MDSLEKEVQKYLLGFYGSEDRLIIPPESIIKNGGHFLISGSKTTGGILFIFPHSSMNIPDDLRQYMLTDIKRIAKVVGVNLDFGTRTFQSRLLQDQVDREIEVPISVAYFDISRVAIDPNRLVTEEQIVERAYKGESIWIRQFDKSQVSKKYVDPFFTAVENHVKRVKPGLVVHWHTFDEYGGGKTSGPHEKLKVSYRRPPSMIFQKYSFTENAFGKYSKVSLANFDFLSDRQIQLVMKNYVPYLARIHDPDPQDRKMTIDEPYISPRMLPGLIHSYCGVPQFVVETREDLISRDIDTVYAGLLDTTLKLYNSLR